MGLENIAKPAERVCTYFGQMSARTFGATIQASNDHRCRNSDKKKFIKIYSVNQMIKILWKNTCAQTLLYKLQMTSFLQKKHKKNEKQWFPERYHTSFTWTDFAKKCNMSSNVTMQASKDTQISKICEKKIFPKRYYTWFKWTFGYCWDQSEIKNYIVNVITKIPPNDSCDQTLLYKLQNDWKISQK